jgi:tetratricopeptide (TPR) repeat protein
LLTFPIVLVLGPIGAIGILFTALVFAVSRESATPFDIWYEEILPENMTPPEEKMVEYLRLWGEEAEAQSHNLIPFTDILVSGSAEEKQNAIDIMVRNYHPSFAVVLRSALNDPTNTIRAHAVAAITRIEEIYQDKAFLLERRMAEYPDDLENILNLAKHYDEHAHAGLSDADTLVEHRFQAEKLYCKLHDSMGATNSSVFWLLGRLLLRDERSAEALLAFEEALEMSDGIAVPQQRIWYWECLYNLRYFAKLREQVRAHYVQVTSHPGLPQPLLDSIELWVGDDTQFAAVAK